MPTKDEAIGKPVSTLLRARFATPQEVEAQLRNKNTPLDPDVIGGNVQLNPSTWSPTQEETNMRTMILRHFSLGDLNMRKPRREFNDLALTVRSDVDRMAWNSYQPNDGDNLPGDEQNSWKSNAQRPIVRNKIISIASHSTARLIFPKVFAYNEQNEEQEDAGMVMENLMEWSGDQSDYPMTALRATIEALSQPAAIIFTEYAESYKLDENDKLILDEENTGFSDRLVPVNELFIENFYEPDIQKQGYLIWRRVISYSLAQFKYSKWKNWMYVKPGVATIYNDANNFFYEVYDQNLRAFEVEEVLYWNRSLRTFQILVNGILMTPVNNKNPRKDGRYPFAKFGYELIQPNFFYYKSLASKMMQDAKIINALYQMVVDGTYLKLFPPLKNIGGETITSDVLIPGGAITMPSQADISPILPGSDIGTGLQMLSEVQSSIDDTSNDQWMNGAGMGRRTAAYTMSVMQQNANTLLGLFVQMISQFVKDYGKLRISDIIQYMTIGEMQEIEGDTKLVYKAFLIPNKTSGGKNVTRRIVFDGGLPNDPISEEAHDNLSYDILHEEGGLDSKTELWRINPVLMRTLKYRESVSPDTLDPMSTELEKQYGLEQYDRMIQHPEIYDPEATGKLLLGQYRATQRDPEQFLNKKALEQAQNTPQPMPGQPGALPMKPPVTPTPATIGAQGGM